MYQAFPGSDYYEDSVAIGVSPRRQSRVPLDFGDWALLVFTYIHQRSTAIKTALVVLVVVVGFALVVTLATPVSFLVLNRFGLAETWVVGALFSSWHVILVRCAVHGIGVGCRRRSGVAHSQGEMRYVWKRRREPWLRPWWLERIQINQVPVVFDTGRSSAT